MYIYCIRSPMITITNMVCNRRCACLVHYYKSYLTLVSWCSGCCSQTRQTGVVTVWVHCACVRQRLAAKGAHGVRARRVRPGANSRPVVVGRWSSRCATGSCRRRSSFSIHHFCRSIVINHIYHRGYRTFDRYRIPSLRKSLFGRTFFSISTMDYHYDVMNCRTPKEQFAEGVSVPLKCIYSRWFHHPNRRWRPRCTGDNNCTTDIGLATNRGE